MKVAPLLGRLANAGVSMRLDGGELVLSASPGAVTPKFLVELRALKGELVALLRGYRCRHCGDRIDWIRPGGIAFADGMAAHLGCYEGAEIQRIRGALRRATDGAALVDDLAEVMLAGEDEG